MPPFEPDRSSTRERREWVPPLVVLSVAAVLLVLPLPVKQQISAVLRGSIMAPFLQTQEALLNIHVRSDETAELQVRLDSTVAVLLSQGALREENVRLRELLGLEQRPGTGLLAASAMRPGTLGSESMFLLDVGTAHGVSVNDPVVVADG
ncbi:MAG: hypothetical protein EXR92_07030, partial [Gemmatimonadetes bacterium]|nr:hypothetical protein [Gemmatimonadota bacterium]